MKTVGSARRSRSRGVGAAILLGLLALGALVAFSADDFKRYMKIRRM